ncbi:uncharacterized protein [Dermacentor andersoni]|uniref:uncharacterized protein n=1 Tax=Dermacentor andersoni TaxID=34620 RepID=UPI003B3A8D73
MITCWKPTTTVASTMLLFSMLVVLCPAYVLVPRAGVVPQTQVVYQSPYQPPVVPVAGPGEPHVIYHYGLGGVRPELQPPVVFVRVIPAYPPTNQPPLQPPFIEEVPPVFKNPPPDPEDTPPTKKPGIQGRGGHRPDCPEVDNKKGIAPPPTRKPSKRGRGTQTRKSRRPPAEATTRRPPSKANRRVNPKSERLSTERLTLAKNP